MRNLIILILFSILVFGCKKHEEPELMRLEGTLSFQVDMADPGSQLKDWPCKLDDLGNLLEPDYAEIWIDGTVYYPEVFRINGVLYTQSIKFLLWAATSDTLEVTRFLLWDDNGTPTDTLDDQIVMGTPEEGSPYEAYITPELRYDRFIVVNAFEKHEFLFEVLCFLDDDYLNFGFDWFVIHEIVIREECFFGDICVKDLSDTTGYAMPGSYYLNQSTGIQIDMPAIFKVHVRDASGANVPNSPFSNFSYAANYGVGTPLCINWPDNLQQNGEEFHIEIWVKVQDGDYSPPFGYNLFWEGTLTETGELYDLAGNFIDPGIDGIVEFVLGECNYSDTDIQLTPYQNLPAVVDMYCQGLPYTPGDLGTYFDITLSGIPVGYDLHNGEYGVYCGDQDGEIFVNHMYYDTEVYGSMYPENFPSEIQQQLTDNIDLANWLFNNLENYPGYCWDELQDALWILLDSEYEQDELFNDPPTPTTTDMVADAQAYGDGYLPLPGGYAAIIFWNGENTQLVFAFVDP